MFAHVHPRLFQRRPFLGVRLGAVSLAFWSPVGDVVSRRGLGNTPATVDLSQIAPPGENPEKWVGSTKLWSCIAISAPRRSRSHRKAGSSAESQRLSSSRELKVRSQLVAGLRRRRRLREPEGPDDGRRSRRDQLAPSKLSAGRRICLPARAAAVGRRRSSKLSPTYDLVHVLAVIIDLLDCAVLA